MNSEKVFITGGAGFLGASIIQLIADNYEVMATKRTHTDMFRCTSFYEKVKWVDTTVTDYHHEVIEFRPNIIIHAAWSGVSEKERKDWFVQLSNFNLLSNILNISEQANVKKIIFLGSQAEYGMVNDNIDEDCPVSPNDAYALCKLSSQKIIETFCTQKNIDWYWLRVFSVFGPTEADNWFIPWVINNQLKNIDVDVTLCEQEYDYLYINDFAVMVKSILDAEISAPGIYNICSGKTIQLKVITDIIYKSISGRGKLNYGAIPYRANQSMKISGNNNKYNNTFGEIKITNIDYAIAETISYYKDRYN